MEYEPLRDKKTEFIEKGYVSELRTEGFVFDSVKSAVEGLKHDIKHEKEFIMFPSAGRKALNLVRKWFPDAIDNDTKERIE